MLLLYRYALHHPLSFLGTCLYARGKLAAELRSPPLLPFAPPPPAGCPAGCCCCCCSCCFGWCPSCCTSIGDSPPKSPPCGRGLFIPLLGCGIPSSAMPITLLMPHVRLHNLLSLLGRPVVLHTTVSKHTHVGLRTGGRRPELCCTPPPHRQNISAKSPSHKQHFPFEKLQFKRRNPRNPQKIFVNIRLAVLL